MYSNRDHPLGLPRHLDRSGHEVTMQGQWAADLGQKGPCTS